MRFTLALVVAAVLAGSATAAASPVSLWASATTVHRGAAVTLSGVAATTSSDGAPAPSTVAILARRDRSHPFGRIAVVHADQGVWRLRVRPARSTTYLAVAAAGSSRPVRVRVIAEVH